ncbi:MAG TPA: ABC transporter substrate-binding protein, partial [Balneolaceae bacterium]|nr:ABC transporter substrate-binding protein [Balneolaceae bacterium]
VSQDEPERDEFQKLVMGEFNTIGSLDPLFANNATEMRAVQLVYEGLVRFDENGNITPGIAQTWTVSDDSSLYEFHLRPDIFYHNSDIFSTGTGRRLVAEDVKFVFERMARAGVPPRAAKLFMNIRGFDSYFQEQHFVYNPQFRQIEGVAGIQTPDETTVVFELEQPDANFLKKLATPLAVIYPKEAVGDAQNAFTPVGTGPFTFVRTTNDSTYIFSKFDNYHTPGEIKLDRVDLIVTNSEGELFKSMSAEEMDVLPQLGPQLMSEILDDKGQLLPSYREQYALRTAGGATEYVLRYNPYSNLAATTARKIAGLIPTDLSSFLGKLPQGLVESSFIIKDAPAIASHDSTKEIYSTFSADPFIKTFLGSLSKTLKPYGYSLQMLKIHTPVENTGLLVTRDFPLIPEGQWGDYEKLFVFKVGHAALQKPVVEGLWFNQYPWWIDVRGVSLMETSRLN